MASKIWLVDLVKAARADFYAFVDDLTPAQRNATATIEQWSPKDEIAHNTFWVARMAEGLRAVRDGQPAPDTAAFTNEIVWEQRKAWTWADVMAEVSRAFDEALAQINRFEYDELTDAARFSLTRDENQPKRPLLSAVIGNIMMHPYAHFMDMYTKRGDTAKAIGLQARMVSLMKDGGDTRLHGTSVYNLACAHALAGNTATAMTLLNEALTLVPDLKEWSRQDGDLASLRELPEFQALVTA